MDINENERLLTGLKNQDNGVLREIYESCFASVCAHIRKNSGSEEDARDIFQEAIIIMYRKIKEDGLELTCSLKTYLFSVCKYQWLKMVSKKDLDYYGDISAMKTDNYVDEGIVKVMEEHERYAVYQKHFERLNEYCRKLLKLFLENIPLKEIAEIMGYANEKVAKQRKYLCKEHLLRSIQQDPRYNELI